MGPLGLIVRQARGTVVGWTMGMLLGGLVVGGLLGSVATLVDDPAVRELLHSLAGSAGTVEDVYVATEVRFVAVAVAAAGIALVLRLVAAERRGIGGSSSPRPRAAPAGSAPTCSSRSRCRRCS